MITPGALEKVTAEAQQLIMEMSEKLSKYDAKVTALFLNRMQTDLSSPSEFPEQFSSKKISTEAANKRLEEFRAAVNNPDKYPLESRIEEAGEMQAILQEYQQKIAGLYDAVLGNE